jgi:Protein of unknown function (DUF2958)
MAFGLCDLGVGHPEQGHVWISDLEKFGSSGILPVERNKIFRAEKTLNEYTVEAQKIGRISIY